MTTVLAVAGLALLVTAVISGLPLVRGLLVISVTGLSMSPTLRPGDRLLVRRVPPQSLRAGEMVVVSEPGPCRPGDPSGTRHSRLVVKRLVAVPGDPEPPYLPAWARQPAGLVAPGKLILLGDNPGMSRDSRHFGPVPADRVVGRVLRRLF